MRHSINSKLAGVIAVTAALLLGGCQTKIVQDDPNAEVDFESAPKWKNWSGELKHFPSKDGKAYYFSPTGIEELKQVIRMAKDDGVELRVSGQRHAQPPLVVDNNRHEIPKEAKTYLVDLSCYADLGPKDSKIKKQIVLIEGPSPKVRVNTGVREDGLDAFLTRNGYALKTVTAGGFFSLGGMTAIDVHGATIDEGIFAETVSEFTVMGLSADGRVETKTIRRDEGTIDAAGKSWHPIQFARVSLGALGIVTSVTIDVMRRPHATSIVAGSEKMSLKSRDAFIEAFKPILNGPYAHDRIETFYSPYTTVHNLILPDDFLPNNFLTLWWNDIADLKADKKSEQKEETAKSKISEVASSCTFADRKKFGAPYEKKALENLVYKWETFLQRHGSVNWAAGTIEGAFGQIESMFSDARKDNSDLWLTAATRVAFMSYFVELPDTEDEGLGKVWDLLRVVAELVQPKDAEFRLAAPLEFRFVKGGDSALSGTYTERKDATFVNLDLLAYVPKGPSEDWPESTLNFFADVERAWYGEGGMPHNGKMYGFFDPSGEDKSKIASDSNSADTYKGAFNPGFMNHLAGRRGERLEAFEAYRRQRDPHGLFCNDFLRSARLCDNTEKAK